ncbi:MAG TPA: carboxylesterase [Deltaproteobacteria bacterium]|nr:carboxylesterase [Deltaproteobacteria bacterium]
MDYLPCIEHTPGVPAEGSVIWLHGLGASGSDFSPLVPHLGLPRIRFVFPHAPTAPVTINQGHVMPSWYDIRSLDHDRPDREDPAGVQASATAIGALIQREISRGLPHSRIVLAGFSQGAAMALHVGLRRREPLAGLVVLSGYVVLADTWSTEITSEALTTPVFFGHGRDDEVVPIEGGRAAHRATTEAGATTTWRDYPMGHEVCPEEISDLRRWLHACFAPGR